MFTKELTALFLRDLGRLSRELSAYESENDLWIVERQINNSAGNLAIHLIGNLNHFIGHGIGGSDYVRDRSFEFEGTGVPRKRMLEQIAEVKVMIEKSLSNLTAQDLEEKFPIPVFDEPISTRAFLLHLFGHLSYHLGQINYHRRLLTQLS